ncbi:dsDNA nuclease domain-containing protein [Streptomyces griseorubiginosus]|uniref:dsDNA nuclease domain-containing protein n=1 Tax=Streptomyces griseorubiginosus TaxID=67304 RepID=UPI0036930B7A
MSLHEISGLAKSLITEPAEDSGSDTSSRYNFQHQCAARHCFAMLTDSQLKGVVCEWHVDYVLIYEDGTNELVSVKHREPQTGPWPFSELWTKGGLATLYARWRKTPEAKCRLITNGSMKSTRDVAAAFSQSLTSQNVEDYVTDAADKLDCGAQEAREFLKALRIEHGIPDRVTLRAHSIVNVVEDALAESGIRDCSAAEAWDAVVNLVASKSRDLDNRDFSSIDLASSKALDSDVLTSAKAVRRTITRHQVVKVLAAPREEAVADYPHTSNLWMREPVSDFFGRRDTLQEIEESLKDGLASKPSIALIGMSGVGKSELLAQYAWEHAERYKFVWWVRADSLNAVVTDLSFLAEELGLPVPDSDDGLRQMKQYFLKNRGLILLDGAPANQEILNLIPKVSATQFLISSLDQSWAANVATINVTPLSDADAIALLASTLSDASQDDLVALNEALNGLPLALRQAAGYIATSGIPLGTYTGMVRDRASELLSRSAPPEHVGLTAALSITTERLQKDHSSALALLHVFSFLAPHGFPTELFKIELTPSGQGREGGAVVLPTSVEVEQLAANELADISPSAARLLELLQDHLSLFDAVADLQRFSLIEAQQNGVNCHALTQAVVRQSLTQGQAAEALEVATVLLNKVANLSPFDSRFWPHYRHMMPHFEALLAYLEDRGQLPDNTILFYSAITLNLGIQGFKGASLSYADKAMAKVAGQDDVAVTTRVFVRTLLVEALTGSDRWNDALRVVEETLAIAAEEPVDSVSMATLHTKKAAVLHLQGKLEEALLEFDRAHTYAESCIDSDDMSNLKRSVRANKATLKREMGDARGSAQEFKALISEYPETSTRNGLATLYSNLALAHLDATDFEDALTASEKALEIDYDNSDGFHLDAARDWNNTGLALLELSRADDAVAAFEAALRIHEHLGNVGSTLDLIVRMNLGRAQLAGMDFITARKTFEETLKRQEEVLGSTHRDIASTLANLAVVYTGMRLFGDAAAAAHRAIKIDLVVYGEGHPELIPDYNNLAGALMMAGSYRAALKWLRKGYKIALETFGSGNVRVGYCLEKIAVCAYSSGDVAEGIAAMRETVEIFDSKLGADHSETMSCRSLLGQMRQRKFPLDWASI